MKLNDIARHLPEDIWAVFEPILPGRIYAGVGRKPYSNRECLHALLYVLASGIAWEMLPWCFPSYKTVQRCLKRWLRDDAFLRAWALLAGRYEALHGINWDQILLDGSKKPSKKGAKRRGHLRSIAASRAAPSTSRATPGPCPWA
jgi:transposase